MMNPHGQVNWRRVDDSLERWKLAKVIGAMEATDYLNLRNLTTHMMM
jgi:hypothetical protein